MENSTEDGKLNTTRLQFCTATPEQGVLGNIILSALNIFLSVTAVLGNVLILVALKGVVTSSSIETTVSLPRKHPRGGGGGYSL